MRVTSHRGEGRGPGSLNRAAFVGSALAASAGLLLPAGSRAAGHGGAGVPPDEALAKLVAGNKRFVAGTLTHADDLVERREALVDGQTPFATILCCSDSRVPPELAFDQGLGDLFITRVAGNFPDDAIIGSIEYSIEHLGARLVMVLGHQSCGAIKATYSAIKTKKPLPKHLDAIQRLMGPGIMRTVLTNGGEEAAVEANVRAAVAALQAAPPVISKGVGDGSIRVVGAEYHLGTGAITLL